MFKFIELKMIFKKFNEYLIILKFGYFCHNSIIFVIILNLQKLLVPSANTLLKRVQKYLLFKQFSTI